MSDRTNKFPSDKKTGGMDSRASARRGKRDNKNSWTAAAGESSAAYATTDAEESSSRAQKAEASRRKQSSAAAHAAPLCRFFALHGDCRYGEDCRFSHTLPQGGLIEARKQIPCRFYLQGNCRYGDYCEFRHDATKPKHTCGICFEAVGNAYNRRFGLLEGCNHVYCMDCIMSWRTEGSSEAEDRRVCPSCRKKSLYIIPSWEYCVGEEKEQVMNDYKARLAVLPCKHFDGTPGSCPFGRDCFYAHLQGNKDVKSEEKSMEELQNAREERRRQRHEMDDIQIIQMFLMLMELSLEEQEESDDWRDSDYEDDEY